MPRIAKLEPKNQPEILPALVQSSLHGSRENCSLPVPSPAGNSLPRRKPPLWAIWIIVLWLPLTGCQPSSATDEPLNRTTVVPPLETDPANDAVPSEEQPATAAADAEQTDLEANPHSEPSDQHSSAAAQLDSAPAGDKRNGGDNGPEVSQAEQVDGQQATAASDDRSGAGSQLAQATDRQTPVAGDGQRASNQENRPLRKSRDGTTYQITFEDLFLDMPPDTKFDESLLTDRVEKLDGQRVKLSGFIFPGGIFQQTGITQFPFVMNTECKFGPGGEAFCVILVEMEEGRSTSFTTRPIHVEGTLHVDPFNGPDGNTWSVYRMEDGRVTQ